MRLDRLNLLSDPDHLSFTSHGQGASLVSGGQGVSAFAGAPADPPGDAALARLAERGRAEPLVACPLSTDPSHEAPGLARRYAIEGASVVSMSAAQHVDRYGAEVRERLERLWPKLYGWLDELRPDLDRWQLREIKILGHLKGNHTLSGVVADRAKGYLMKLGYEALRIRVEGKNDGRTTFGVTVCVYGAPRARAQARDVAPAA